MGGTAYIVKGEIDLRLLEPRPTKRNFFDRLLGRQRFSEPEYIEMGEKTLVTIPPAELEGLGKELYAYLNRKIGDPSEATKGIFGFLDEIGSEIYVRGERGDGKEEWYLQFSYSGCAGMAEVSAAVCAHWVNIWFESERHDIFKKWLEPYGFNPDPVSGNGGTKDFFMPTADFGYALLYEDPTVIFVGDGEEKVHFELDAACTEGNGEWGDSWGGIEEKSVAAIKAGVCFCQLCVEG